MSGTIVGTFLILSVTCVGNSIPGQTVKLGTYGKYMVLKFPPQIKIILPIFHSILAKNSFKLDNLQRLVCITVKERHIIFFKHLLMS